MAIKIKRLKIKNFKLFEEIKVDFTDSNLIIFDGPNGFGKTSFYDAVELLFTGSLRRYNELITKTVDRRQSFEGHPLLCDRGQGNLEIVAEILANEEIVCLKRVGEREALEAATSFGDFKLKLYVSEEYDTDDYDLIEDEERFLSNLLGQSYKENFEFLNYIEQEENIYLLKNKDKDRKNAIAHLFNTKKFEERIDKLKEASKKISSLCNQSIKKHLLMIRFSLTNIEKNLQEKRRPSPLHN